MSKLNVLIIFGGKSNEYEVSLKSASAVIDNIDKDKYNVMNIGITRDGKWLRYDGSTDNIRNDVWYNHESCKEAFLSPCQSHKGFIEISNIPSTTWKVCRRWNASRIIRTIRDTICRM